MKIHWEIRTLQAIVWPCIGDRPCFKANKSYFALDTVLFCPIHITKTVHMMYKFKNQVIKNHTPFIQPTVLNKSEFHYLSVILNLIFILSFLFKMYINSVFKTNVVDLWCKYIVWQVTTSIYIYMAVWLVTMSIYGCLTSYHEYLTDWLVTMSICGCLTSCHEYIWLFDKLPWISSCLTSYHEYIWLSD